MKKMSKKAQVLLSALLATLLLAALPLTAFAAGEDDFVIDGNGVLTNYTGPGGDVIIPGDRGITAIGSEAFKGNATITGVVIPDGVTTIGSWAFVSCTALESITIPGSVTTIGTGAFRSCTALKSVTIQEGVQ
jgi:hypothetical protein